ncbi:MAG: 50S ribosomal protein L6 [Pseudomonadota bacterium]
MSRIAKQPITLPKGVELQRSGQNISLKGSKGNLSFALNSEVDIEDDNGTLTVKARSGSRFARAMAGTTRAILSNMAHGVSEGWEKKLTLVGVGYRAQAQGTNLNLTLGFSHPVVHKMPEGVTVETPSQTEIVLKGADKQVVGQVAAEIRAYRPPEPYKGKGVRYSDEHVVRKEAKKK